MASELCYSIKHHVRARHIRIKVNGFGDVHVVAPYGVSTNDIDGFVRKNTDWIYKTIEKLKDDRLVHLDLGFKAPTRLCLPAIAKTYQIQYISVDKKPVVKEKDGELTVFSLRDNERTDLLRSWIQKKAKITLIPWLKKISDLHEIPYNKVTIRGQKTRWGSCSNRSNINLNRNLLFLSPELVRYLIVHELSHILQANHSPKFWAIVESFEPNYRQLDKQLSQSSKLVPLWAYQSKNS